MWLVCLCPLLSRLRACCCFLVDTGAPAKPATPVLDPASDTGVSDSDGITSDSTPTVTGTADPGSDVRLVNNATGALVATTQADDNGAYSVTVTPALADGTTELQAVVVDDVGNESPPSNILALQIGKAH